MAQKIDISKTASFGENIDININGIFSLGKFSKLGNDTHIRGNNISFGDHLFHSSGLRIGGGGRDYPNANLKIGDRCTIHNNFINVCEPVEIGDDVGLSQEVAIITHGYWLSVFEGYPTKFSGVKINDGAIIGYRSTILPGVRIGINSVIGANSIISKDVKSFSIYAGNPAKFIREVNRKYDKEKNIIALNEIMKKYKEIVEFHKLKMEIKLDYPYVTIDEDCIFDLEMQRFNGLENENTDHFRDFIRKYGIRFYSERPFKSVNKRDL